MAYFDEMLDELKVATGRKASDRTFKQINLKAYYVGNETLMIVTLRPPPALAAAVTASAPSAR